MTRSNIKDVAAQAGVSVATVSRALRGLPNVSAATRSRVLKVARDLEYSADSRASSLASGRTNVIALVAPNFGTWYIGQTVVGVESTLAVAGYDLLVLSIERGPDQHDHLVNRLKNRRVDGLLLFDFFLPSDRSKRTLDSLDLPVVLSGEQLSGYASLNIDNYAGGRMAVAHLLELGHKRVAFLGGPVPEIVPDAADGPRKQGAIDELADAGLTLTHDLKGRYSIEGGRAAFDQIHALGADMPTAVFCASDEMAVGLMARAREVGLSIPGDLSIVGFDDHEMAEPLGLTTIRQEVRHNGARAAELLLELIHRDPDDPSSSWVGTANYTAGLALVIRSSTGTVS